MTTALTTALTEALAKHGDRLTEEQRATLTGAFDTANTLDVAEDITGIFNIVETRDDDEDLSRIFD